MILGPELTRNLSNRISISFFRIEFNLHLVGQEMNHQAGILRIIITKDQIRQRSKKRLSRSKIEIQFGEFVHFDMACSV